LFLSALKSQSQNFVLVGFDKGKLKEVGTNPKSEITLPLSEPANGAKLELKFMSYKL
jgi:hypothetical protein